MIALDQSIQQTGTVLILNSRETGDITTVAALRLSLSTGVGKSTIQDALKQSVPKCIVGWTHKSDETRMIFLEALDAAEEAVLKDVQVQWMSAPSAESKVFMVQRDWDCLWLRFTEFTNAETGIFWISTPSNQFWRRSNRTFDLTGARQEALNLEDTGAETTPRDNAWIANIRSCGTQSGMSEIALYFSQRSASLDDGIVSSIRPYSAVDFQQVKKPLQEPKHRCVLNDARVIDASLQLQNLPDKAVAYLEQKVLEPIESVALMASEASQDAKTSSSDVIFRDTLNGSSRQRNLLPLFQRKRSQDYDVA